MSLARQGSRLHVITLVIPALGIDVTAAVFAPVNAVLIRPLGGLTPPPIFGECRRRSNHAPSVRTSCRWGGGDGQFVKQKPALSPWNNDIRRSNSFEDAFI